MPFTLESSKLISSLIIEEEKMIFPLTLIDSKYIRLLKLQLINFILFLILALFKLTSVKISLFLIFKFVKLAS